MRIEPSTASYKGECPCRDPGRSWARTKYRSPPSLPGTVSHRQHPPVWTWACSPICPSHGSQERWDIRQGQDPHFKHCSVSASLASRHLAAWKRTNGQWEQGCHNGLRAFAPPPHWPQLAQGLEGVGRKGKGPQDVCSHIFQQAGRVCLGPAKCSLKGEM